LNNLFKKLKEEPYCSFISKLLKKKNIDIKNIFYNNNKYIIEAIDFMIRIGFKPDIFHSDKEIQKFKAEAFERFFGFSILGKTCCGYNPYDYINHLNRCFLK